MIGYITICAIGLLAGWVIFRAGGRADAQMEKYYKEELQKRGIR